MINKLKDKFLASSDGAYRIRQVAYTGFSSLGAKGINTFVTIVSVPLTLNYLGAERYGMIMTILSFIGMMHYADLGLGLGLLNRIPQLDLNKNRIELKKSVSSTFFLLVFCSAIMGGIFFMVYPKIEWYNLFNVKGELAIKETSQCIMIFMCCFLITIPFSLVQKVQGGYQEGYYNEIWKAAGNIFGLILLLVFIKFKYGSPYLILAIFGSSTLFIVLNFLFQFLFRRRYLFPRISLFDRKIVAPLFKEGSIFFVLQFFAAVCNSSDSFIIANVINAEAVAQYTVGFKLFLVFMLPISIFISPMLPAFNDAFARGENEWVKKVARKTLFALSSLSLIFVFLYYFLSNHIVNIWIGQESLLPVSLVLAFSIFILVYNLNIFFSTIFSTSNLVTFLFKIYPFAVIGVILVKIFLATQFGISGVLWGSIIALPIFFFIPSFLKLKNRNLI